MNRPSFLYLVIPVLIGVAMWLANRGTRLGDLGGGLAIGIIVVSVIVWLRARSQSKKD